MTGPSENNTDQMQLLQAVLDSSPYIIQVFAAVRNAEGEIVDFIWTMNNRKGVEQNGDVIGKSVLEQNPGIAETGIFEKMKQVTETGIPCTQDVHYTHEQFNSWFRQNLIKLHDGVVMNTENISELKASRKLLQATLDSNQEMIQVFEAVRDQDGQIIDFIWLLNNNAAAQVYGEVIGKSLLTYNPGVKDEGIFDAFVEVTETGIPKQYEKHYVHEQFNGWFHQSVVKLNDGVATTTVNISSRKRAEEERFRTMREAEEKIRRMQAEQQLEIFRVSLSTLEEERYRISESLHNGIGQILYGIKINLMACRPEMSPEKFKETKTYVSKLLTEAIVETRRISHELMPTTLDQFGLKSAIDDICLQLSGDTKFYCRVTGVHTGMEKYLELAIYRTAQELMTNVVKHAGATVCDVMIHIDRKQITITVKDNGQGMRNTEKRKPGIGLASIRSKIKLLNGQMQVDSTLGRGTAIEIIIPQPTNKKKT